MFWRLGQNFIANVRKKRVHVWAAFYFIGIWNALEPMITFFGFSEPTIEIIRNIGIALFPLIIISAWFHGEPGTQKPSLSEGLSLIVGLILTGIIYYNLSRTPPQIYTMISPISSVQKSWFQENILKEFDKKNHVKINLQSFENNYEDEIFKSTQLKKDSSRVLLVKVPLPFTGVMLTENKNYFVSYEEIVTEHLDGYSGDFDSLVAKLDPYAVRFGRRQSTDNQLYYMPAEYQTMALFYLKSKVENAAKNWQRYRNIIAAAFHEITGYYLPNDFDLESDPDKWDYFDMFVANWYWANQVIDGEKMPKFAYPCKNNIKLFFYILNRALCQSAEVEQIFNLPQNRSLLPPEEIADVFFWDAIFRRAGLFYPGMWLGNGLSESEIVELFKTGKIFMAFLSGDELAQLAKLNPDLEIASIPAGARLTGERVLQRGFTNVWYWAVPKSTPSFELSYRLVHWLNTKENQVKLAKKFWTIPTRQNLLKQMKDDSSTTTLLMKTNLKQIQINKRGENVINPFKHFDKGEYDILLSFYYMKWQAIVKGEGFLTLGQDLTKKNVIGMLML